MGNKPARENKMLDKEYAERIQAEQCLAYGNYAGATWHDARADRWGYKADRVHYGMYNKGNAANGQAYALHPIPPAGGIAAYQPGIPTASQMLPSATPLGMPGSPMGYNAMAASSGYPAAMPAMMPAAYGPTAYSGAYPAATTGSSFAMAPVMNGAYGANMW